MIIRTEVSLSNFEFWSGAEVIANELTEEQFNIIEAQLEMDYPDGMSEEDVNDIFRFEEDYIAQILGYSDWDEFVHRNDEDEDYEEDEEYEEEDEE